jgi:hypothetical protein
MNALEQRMATKQKIVKLLEQGYSKEKLKSLLEEETHIDRHRLNKYYYLLGDIVVDIRHTHYHSCIYSDGI